ncbi:uncharacterized protein LOC122512624 [Leptopilina heterotoma]|uniref:uncharacterized protein LOC122512624 n=1 Tax=Leptopilina heterotoma TaxID=63436 RepID=UPI001CA82CA0|nr:uncharacterized protein LOC122512624 [Leptopilina heterotoma]
MNTTNFTSPLEFAQIIPIYTYVNIISSFLFVESELTENDLYKHIPTVNALYKYFKTHKHNKGKKLDLVRGILTNTDLYGSHAYEDLDETFINTMLEYFVKSVVFQKYHNIFGFLANVTLGMQKITYTSVIQEATTKLREMDFENEYGPNSKLSPLAVKKIIIKMIVPLFPVQEKDLEIFSIDYIYAQAGLAFFRSNGKNVMFYLKGNSSEMYLWKHEMYQKILFEECVEMGHLVEQLTLANKINASAITVFALPAFLYYVHNQKDNMTETIGMIMNTRRHWSRAFHLLFNYLESELNKVKQSLIPTEESEFYQAVSNFKNRSTIARENILKYCLQTEELDQMIENYKNDNNDYYCNNFTNIIKLPDLRELFMRQLKNLKQKCYRFEMKKLKEAFGGDFIRKMNQADVEIYNGIYIAFHESAFPKPPMQSLAYPNIAFKCHFPKNATTEYYALIQEDNNLRLVKESDNPMEFRQKLNLTFQVFRKSDFFYRYKTVDEKFELFLSRLASEQTSRIGRYLERTGYEETRIEWWRNFGLSLVPFYNCINSIFDNWIPFSYTSCIIDAFMMIPMISTYLRTSSVVARIIAIPLSSVRSLLFKFTIQAVLQNFRSFATLGLQQFVSIFNQNFYKQLGASVIRLVDPGVEMVYKIGTNGFKSMKTVIEHLKEKFVFSTSSIEVTLANAMGKLNRMFLKVGQRYGRNVYVNSFDGTSGYGFRYLNFGRETAELRGATQGENSPYLLDHITPDNVRIYRKVDTLDWKVEETDVIFKEKETKLSNEITIEMTISHDDDLILCEGGNFLCIGQVRSTTPDVEIDRLRTLGMDEPELFYQLQNAENFKSFQIKNSEQARKKIEKLYSTVSDPRAIISSFAEEIFPIYKSSQFSADLQFEDFLAIRYYGLDGYKEIRGESDLAKRMKNAIYRLAIRQSQDSIENYSTLLYRGENCFLQEVEKIFYPGRRDFQFTHFTSTSTDPMIAKSFTCSFPCETRVMYELNFERPYMRANVEKYMIEMERETILLPGTKFKINDMTWEEKNGRKTCLTVKLSYDYEAMNLINWQKNIMSEIKQLKESSTVFYVNDLKK